MVRISVTAGRRVPEGEAESSLYHFTRSRNPGRFGGFGDELAKRGDAMEK